MRPALLPTLFLAAAAVSQAQIAVVPVTPSFTNVDRPFAGGIGRYQQWYSGASLATQFTQPLRIEQVEFFAGAGQTTNATSIDLEVSLAFGLGSGVTGQFDLNFASQPVVVVPRRTAQLLAGASGQPVMILPFSQRFTWDGVSPLLIDIKVYGNGRGNQPFVYDMRGTTTGLNQTTRVYQQGSANATFGQTQQNMGMITRFTARPGVTLDFGAGCPGQNGFVPLATVQQVPSPGIQWTHQLQQAASQRFCVWILGDSSTQFGPLALPIDLGVAFGGPPFGCDLLTNPVATFFTTTIGGGPGAGLASVQIQLPPVTSYVGLQVYSQWLVADPFAPNGQLAVSQGIWSIVAPVGG